MAFEISCPECGQVFSYTAGLYKHLSWSHGYSHSEAFQAAGDATAEAKEQWKAECRSGRQSDPRYAD